MPMPSTWKLVLYFGCIGMFGIGVGMLYTPILVDRLQLEYPSGHAVANILRALTDPKLLRRSIGRLGGGTAVGLLVAFTLDHLDLFARFFRWLASKNSIAAQRIFRCRIMLIKWINTGSAASASPMVNSVGNKNDIVYCQDS